MTFGEIYNAVVFRVWGNSTVPAGTTAQLTGDEGIIANVHRNIMRDYNYWFMRAHANGQTVSGTQAYSLPSEWKEIISIVFKTEGEDYFQPPLKVIGLKAGPTHLWQSNNDTAEYPTYFEIVENSIVFYPVPSEDDRDYHIIYWEFFERPSAFTDGTNTEYDDLTVYGADAIINLATAEILDILDEVNKAQIYRQRGMEAIELLKAEDRAKRQNIHDTVLTKDF